VSLRLVSLILTQLYFIAYQLNLQVFLFRLEFQLLKFDFQLLLTQLGAENLVLQVFYLIFIGMIGRLLDQSDNVFQSLVLKVV